MSARYAVYFAPGMERRWWAFGCGWLGYDAVSGARVAQPAIADVTTAEFEALTAEPRRYGFHGTLKAPMRLAAGTDEGELAAALAAFAAERRAFTLPAMRVERVRHFLACTPAAGCEPLQALADDCVRAFDRFRAPPAPAELAKRRAAGLDAQASMLLERWGYPYVFEAFRFHLTLTGPLAGVAPATVRAVTTTAEQALEALADEPLVCDAVCLFVQRDVQSSFRMTRRFGFPR